MITIKQLEAYVITERQKNLSTALLLGLHESVNLKNTFLEEISEFYSCTVKKSTLETHSLI